MSRVREEFGLSGAQLRRFIAVGLLEEPMDGGWSADVIGRIAAICALGRSVQSLRRRVILLGYDLRPDGAPLDARTAHPYQPPFAIPPDTIRAAMRKIVPLIPAKRMRAISAACMWYARRLAGASLKRRSLPDRWKPPVHKEWDGILEQPDNETFAWHLPEAYNTAYVILPRYERETNSDLGEIPMEERVTLSMIRHLAALPEMYPYLHTRKEEIATD
jgi:hypothetical protein